MFKLWTYLKRVKSLDLTLIEAVKRFVEWFTFIGDSDQYIITIRQQDLKGGIKKHCDFSPKRSKEYEMKLVKLSTLNKQLFMI